MLELPTLYAKNAAGKLVQWTVSTDNDVVVMEYGQVGAKLVKTKTRCTPTNVGRSNERNGVQQAEFEAKAAWDKKRDEGYFETTSAAETSIVYLPMLAHPLIKKVRVKGVQVEKRRPFDFPVDVQRKLNGLRCLATNKRLISRQGTEWQIPHIHNHVRMFLQTDEMLDGEVYCHGTPLQMLNSLIKVNREESKALEYHVYDFPISNEASTGTWEQRKEQLMSRYSTYEMVCKDMDVEPVIKLVPTIQCHNEDQIKVLNLNAMSEGYEGLILRKLTGLYAWNDRTDALLKWKTFMDSEFVVVDMQSRELIEDGRSRTICDVCICENDRSKATFKVVPIGSIPMKEDYWKRKDELVGQKLVVRYLERSVDGIPQGNPVGIAFRLTEDAGTDDDMAMWKND